MAADANTPNDQRFAPPTAEVADIAVTSEDRLAGRGTRLLSSIVDMVVQIAALALVGWLTPWNVFSPQFNDGGFTGIVAGLALGLVSFLLINGVPLVQRGQTVGKIVTGIRIVRRDGSRVDPLRILGLRYALSWVLMVVPMVGYLYALVDSLFIFRADRRCVHDLIADTIVVKA